MANSILRYYKPRSAESSGLPSPSGPLSTTIPPAAISSANREVEVVLNDAAAKSKRGPYKKYTPKERADIGKFGAENGVQAAVRKYSRVFRKPVNESTVRQFKRAYLAERARKRRAGDDDLTVEALAHRKRGRPLLVGSHMDSIIQEYILKVRESKGVVNTSIVIAGARGLLKRMDRTRLAEYGGPATLSRGWAKSLLQRMKFCRRMCTTKAQFPPERVKELKVDFLQSIVATVVMEEIPVELILNWDQTGLNLVPASNWTLERKGAKRVGIKGFKDKRMITGVFCCSAVGEMLPFQIIYGGKTDRCHPPQEFPRDWSVTHSAKHWSNEDTMLLYISHIVVPYVNSVRHSIGVGKEQAALTIFDRFRGQLTERVFEALEEENIQSVLVPAGCTDQLQPLDLTVNRVAKSFLQARFREWYAEEVANQLSNNDGGTDFHPEPIDLSTARMKSIGVKWLIKLYEHLCANPIHAVNGFITSDILQSIDAGKPVLTNETVQQVDESDDTEDDCESGEGDTDSSEDEIM